MKPRGTIPIVVGVTGHRDIRNGDREILLEAVKKELSALREKLPHAPLLMLNSLAEGADQLCAEAALALGIPLIAVLPMEKAAYEVDFAGVALSRFRTYCDGAEACFVAPQTEPLPDAPDRDYAYRQAGIYVATHAHVLLALWDGKESPSSTCGTAETVRFTLDSAYRPTGDIPLKGFAAVLHIAAPRAGDEDAKAGTVRFLGDREAFERGLANTDEFDRLTAAQAAPESRILPQDREPDEGLDRLEALYAKADALSVRFAQKYRHILAALAVISTIITTAFLLYDEVGLYWMILVCGIMLLLAWLVQRLAERTACHRRYLEYRMLAEGLRVQSFLRYAGSPVAVADILPWTEQSEAGWIAAALKVSLIGVGPYEKHSVKAIWAEQQKVYHCLAVNKSDRALKGSDRIVNLALMVSILLYLAVLVFELLWGGLLPGRGAVQNADQYRFLPKLLLGGISAATLFISNYYGRLSLSRTVADHKKMAQFYAAVQDRMDRYGETDDLLLRLAREELIENSNWNAYRQGDDATFSL